MRSWLGVRPEELCRAHLLGEHSELHRAVGNLNHSGKWARALIVKGYLEPRSFLQRHDVLAKEMLCRGYKHKSPLDVNGHDTIEGRVDRHKARKDLMERCEECRKRIKQ